MKPVRPENNPLGIGVVDWNAKASAFGLSLWLRIVGLGLNCNSSLERSKVRTPSSKDRKSRNKVSVGEPAEGSLPKSLHSFAVIYTTVNCVCLVRFFLS